MSSRWFTAPGFSHAHILNAAGVALCGAGVASEHDVAWLEQPDARPRQTRCHDCGLAADAAELELGGVVHDAAAFKAGARFERRQLAAKLRALVAEHGVGLFTRTQPMLELANELEPREGG